MQRQRTRDTSPEMALRRVLFAQGLRFRIQYPAPGRPRRSIDIAFPKWKLAVFVDGCFWHGCPEHGVAPKNNAEWWRAKLAKNVKRDADTTEELRSQGWRVIRFWEHVDPTEAATQVGSVLGNLNTDPPRSPLV
ncbi:very short patch repair endonuclease [Tessaracoccus antarcticus]|uniref:Very short patch repair endonuclease n=1 Tax=Tessaracoccus antarcticus TaxID=2479848 RepID=A0A3M0GDK1_9ACTN|nr:very short patch repair endonuclease [Tessaracoccus antarcticus]RMB62398.1 very short patch repair endonuclease [Tessaracoccus antarcticus]